MKKGKIDNFFLTVVILLVIIGAIIFISASLGILAKNEEKFYGVIANQFIFGIGGGLVAFYLGYKIPYKFWRKYSLYIFIASIVITLLVFVPGLGIEHGGAKRWINFWGFSFQPVEFLKIGFIIYFASWLSWIKNKVKDFKYSILPLLVLLILVAGILLNQPDTKSIILVSLTSLIMLFVSGVPIKYLFGLFAVLLLGFGVLVAVKPYLMERVYTFMDPSRDGSGASWQLQQSLIAIGSGGFGGRGLGQSIQKFNYLPEPQGDSVFAVVGEELGFIGSVLIIILYVLFALRGYRIAYYSPDPFSKLLVIGIISILAFQSFMNIASIIGVFPLTGVPLVFISHGGTALFLSMGLMGIVLNISQYQKKAKEIE
jgi:cell division protein FtsW